MKLILVVEDDRNLNQGVAFCLKQVGYAVLSAFSLQEARQILQEQSIQFLLLDINLPDGSGLDFCREVRETATYPIVFFTANDAEIDMVKGFEVGCDDYIAKPFSLEVLKYKVQAMLKRDVSEEENLFQFDGLQMDFDQMNVVVDGQDIKLSATEYRLLEILVQNQGKVTTKEWLLEKLWDSRGNFVDENTLHVNIQRLRKKVEPDVKNPRYIITVFGLGYTFGNRG